jgi:hypothetical protein
MTDERPSLFDTTRPAPPEGVAPERRFDGETYVADRDCVRLTGQWRRVATVMCDGEWHTLAAIARVVEGSEAAVSARIRDFRKAKHGRYEVEREFVHAGLWRYRVVDAARLRAALKSDD